MDGSRWIPESTKGIRAFLFLIPLTVPLNGFPGGSVIKNPPANAGDEGLIPGSGRSPRGGNGSPFHYSSWEIPWTMEPGGLQIMGSQKS